MSWYHCNHFTMPVTCDICGGEGTAMEGGGHPWIDRFVHRDRRCCDKVIAGKRVKAKPNTDK